MQTMPAAQQWELFKICLQLTFRETLLPADWAQHAKVQAESIAGALGFALGEFGAPGDAAAGAGDAPPPVLGTGTAAPAPGGPPPSPFGPAFTGWDTESLRMILMAGQQIVIGREQNATPEQLEAVRLEMMQAVDQLADRRKGA